MAATALLAPSPPRSPARPPDPPPALRPAAARATQVVRAYDTVADTFVAIKIISLISEGIYLSQKLKREVSATDIAKSSKSTALSI